MIRSHRLDKQKRYLSQAVQLEEAANPTIVRLTMVTASLAILAFIGWAAVTNINEVARTPGEVVPKGFQQVVQHLEGGIIREIKVTEGQQVEKGQVLLVLDGAGSQDDLNRALSKQKSLALQEERLRAFAENRTPEYSSDEKIDAALMKDQKIFFDSMVEARTGERNVIGEQIQQKKRMITTLQSELETARRNYGITKDLYDRRQALNKKGYTSDVQFLETKQQLNEIDGQVKQLQNRISVSRAEISEFEKRLTSLDAQQQDDAYARIDQVMAEKSQNAELIEKLSSRVGRLEVKSPARGLVKGLAVNTVGAIAQPGQTLMEIVPMDEKMVVEVKIQPQHIGHLKPGLPVQVKFSSFDYSRYGFVNGELKQISATTFTGENGERYYRGLIDLSQDHVGRDRHNMIMPGMTAMAEIITGKKTILQYLLKPVHNAMKTAFTER
jgi:HlyD family secretion protein/adhesin transport system membrane fusion protein